MNEATRLELDDLCGAVRDASIGAAQFDRLQSLLRDVPGARRYYVEYMLICASLRQYDLQAGLPVPDTYLDLDDAGGDGPADELGDAMILPAIRLEEPEPPPASVPAVAAAGPTRKAARLWPGWRWGALAAAVLVASALLLFSLTRPAPTYAVVEDSVDATWDEPVAAGARLGAGSVRLTAGAARILLDSGDIVIATAPAGFSVPGPGRVRLEEGMLTARAAGPGKAGALVVVTPAATVVDQGTEFGVDVEGAATDVQVFEGHVTVTPAMAPQASAPLSAGAGCHVSAAGLVAPATVPASAFVRPQEFDARAKAQMGSPYDRWRAWSFDLRRKPGLVAYYPFESPGPAAVLEDASGHGHDGRLGDKNPATVPAWAAGRWPQKGSLAFRAASHQCVIIPDSPSLNLTGTMTIAAWVKPADMIRYSAHLVNKVDATLSKTFNFCYDFDYGGRTAWSWALYFGGGNREGVSSSVLPQTSRWVFVAVTNLPGGETRFYVDGAPSGSAPAPVGVTTAADVVVGRSHWMGNQDFDGQMDELALFDRVLSPDEIEAMYEAGKPIPHLK